MAYANKQKPTSILLKAIFENGAAPVGLSDTVVHTDFTRRLDEAAPLYTGSVVIDVTFSPVDIARQG
jgi:hypothetical protein